MTAGRCWKPGCPQPANVTLGCDWWPRAVLSCRGHERVARYITGCALPRSGQMALPIGGGRL